MASKLRFEVSLDGVGHDPPDRIHELLTCWNPNGPTACQPIEMVDLLPKGDPTVDEAMNPIASRADADLRH